MFYKYNAALRKFPTQAYESCKIKEGECTCKQQDGTMSAEGMCSCYNYYPTTINAILSGLKKLMWVAPLPKDRFVYRGLSGMNLPPQFFDQDECGVRGGTEFGMMSTTVRRTICFENLTRSRFASLPFRFLALPFRCLDSAVMCVLNGEDILTVGRRTSTSRSTTAASNLKTTGTRCQLCSRSK
jgi:hypothetical protein